MKVIRKYKNRKLYDTETSRYIRLDEIAEVIRSGEDVQVLDVITRNDITSQVLVEILYAEARAHLAPAKTLHSTIRNSPHYRQPEQKDRNLIARL
jgi:polyhydroxyalkanoate synthesis repressor PhaR